MKLEITHNEPNILECLKRLENEHIAQLNQMLNEFGSATLDIKYKTPIHLRALPQAPSTCPESTLSGFDVLQTALATP